MSEKTNSIFSTPSEETGKGTFGGDPASEKDKRIAELESELQRQRVESGRVKKYAEENSELKKQLDEIRASRSEESVDEDLGELKDSIPEDIRKGAIKISDGIAERKLKPILEEVNALKQERTEVENARKMAAVERIRSEIEAKHPGFLASVEGGDKSQPWMKFEGLNGPSIRAAMARGDSKAVLYFIDQFKEQLTYLSDSGKATSPASEPSPIPGEAPMDVGAGKTYTQDEWVKFMNDLTRRHDAHAISEAKYIEIRDELTRAQAERRIKG